VVLPDGVFELETGGRTIILTDPIVRHDAAAAWAPLGVRQVLSTLSAEFVLDAYPA